MGDIGVLWDIVEVLYMCYKGVIGVLYGYCMGESNSQTNNQIHKFTADRRNLVYNSKSRERSTYGGLSLIILPLDHRKCLIRVFFRVEGVTSIGDSDRIPPRQWVHEGLCAPALGSVFVLNK